MAGCMPMQGMYMPNAMGNPNMPMFPMNMNNPFLTTNPYLTYQSSMYGRFRHVNRSSPSYRHAPFDWYRPPKTYHVVHEDAAVLTLDGPIPIGDFYKYYIYGGNDLEDDYDDDYEIADEYDDSYSGRPGQTSHYEQQSVGYRRRPNNPIDQYDEDDMGEVDRLDTGRPPYPVPSSNRYTSLGQNRSRPGYYRQNYRRTNVNDTDSLIGNMDDNVSVNSTYN
ncbi:unnamed protein product [Didymodactylos carnosus]|uniref:Uncharacterized protein n=1 Tax=Didymodactylos carnosus TaxID=1234261 RepID=A0A813R2L8_9BILA|nr:unnamed protein product [Didymodactylos carnosus]CAF3560307.1 unnamed protein product [Didymodactylos carnosus]